MGARAVTFGGARTRTGVRDEFSEGLPKNSKHRRDSNGPYHQSRTGGRGGGRGFRGSG
jgi:hypothetical protein